MALSAPDVEELDNELSDETEDEQLLRKQSEVVLTESRQKLVDWLVDRLMIACDNLSGHPLRAYQVPFARRFFESLIISDGARLTFLCSRQCLDGDSVVFRQDGSAVRLRNHEGVIYTGRKPTKRYRLRGGSELIMTDNHPVLTPDGWLGAGMLRPGDKVSVAQAVREFPGNDSICKTIEVGRHKTPVSVDHKVSADVARFLGYFTTDGSLRPNQSAKFTNTSPAYLAEVTEIVKREWGLTPKVYTKGNGYDLLFTATKSSYDNSFLDTMHAIDWDHGFPLDVFRWSADLVKQFVNRAWAGDGCITMKKSGPDVFLACGNDEIYAQLWRSLLLKFEVMSTIKREFMSKGTGTFHRLVIGCGAKNMRRFFKAFGLIYGKEGKSREAIQYFLDKSALPPSKGRGEKTMYKEHGYGPDGEYLVWARVDSVENSDERDVYDIRVDGKGWFIANGIQVSNSGKSETIANVTAAAMIFLPRLAKVYPELLGKYAEGVLVGAFAPVDEQADTIFGRIVARLSSDEAETLLKDPEIDDRIRGRGRRVWLQNCLSEVRKTTCHPKAKIEGRTYHIIIIDESQDADSKTIRKSVSPMGASTRATHVWAGTPTYNKNVFYDQIQKNKRAVLRRGHVRQNHFEADWKEVAKHFPRYRDAVYDEMDSMGAESDEFLLSYCVAPETRILTADLRHIPASEVTPGMSLAGFDEKPRAKGLHRKIRESIVEDVALITRPCYRLVLDDGTEITASSEHQWIVTTAGRRTIWKTTEQLTETDRIFKITDVWKPDASYEAGYLAAAFDGEGCLSRTSTAVCQIVFAQKENAMLDSVRDYLTKLGFTYGEWKDLRSGVMKLSLNGGRASILRFLGTVRPKRLLDKFDINTVGSIGRHDHKAQDFRHPRVVSKEFIGDQEVVAMRTSTSTFIAEGLASHNCLRWMLDKGQFTTSEKFAELGDITVQALEHTWFHSPVVVGIDCGRKQDKTVVTVVWVDWDHPDAFGYYEHRIINWLDLEGMEWEDQYFRIYDFLQHYNVFAVGVDTGGIGDVVIGRLRVLMPRINFVECPDGPAQQSDRFKYLKTLMERHRMLWPMGAKVRRLKVFRRFRQEMEDAELEYKGPNIIVAAPNARDAHDDFVDSLCNAVSLTRGGIENAAEQPTVCYDNFLFRPSKRY